MRSNLVYIILISLVLFNCKRKEDTEWDVDILSPVVKTTITIDDLVADSILSLNPDNSVNLDYKFSFTPIDDQFYFQIPDTALKAKYGFPFLSPLSLPAGTQFVNDPVENELNLRDSKIEYMEIESGEMAYKITSEVGARTFYTYTIFKTKDRNGNPFSKTISVPAGSRTSPAVVQGTFKFNGYSFDLTGKTGTKFNTFESEVLVNTDPSGPAVTVSNQDTVYIENKLVSLTPRYVRGYLGKSNFVDGPKTNKFSVFEQIISGTLDIDSVDIFTEIKNYVGAEAQIKINQLVSHNTATGNTVPLMHSSIGGWINLDRAVDYYGITPGTRKIIYTKANSNIDRLIENLGDEMTTHFEANLNPFGNISSGNDFLYFNKVIDADFHIKLPLKFIANNLKMRQKINLNINGESNPVNHALVSIYARNGFPFSAEAQMYLLNTGGQIVDSIILTGLISSAITDANNEVVSPTNSVLKAAIPADKMEILNKNSEVVLQLTLNTNGAPHTVIYREHFMDLKLVTDMNMDIKYR